MIRGRARWFAMRALVGACVGGAVAAWVVLGPLPPGLLDPPRRVSTIVLDRNGEVLYESRDGEGGRSIPIEADRLPSTVVDATIAAEDHRFWTHHGIDPIALARAALRDVRQRRIVEGGSTITQQTAKLLLARLDGETRPRGWRRKLREAIVALRLEHRLGKREVLAIYLSRAAYGNQFIGVERASRAYFGLPAQSLTPAQAAFLASLPQRPSASNPYRDPERARGRQERVIVRMGLAGALSADDVREALDEKLTLQREPAAFLAPHFVNRVLAAAGTRQAGTLTTALDAGLQRTVGGIIRAERHNLSRIGAHAVAAVVLDNRTGEWLAWEGSGDYSDEENGGAIDGVTTPRQPGSALKPFTYALAFEQGDTPATVLPDIPSYFPTAQEGVLYSPRNYDNRFRGPLLARRALAGSENVPAVALASHLGPPNVLRFLRSAGLTTFDRNAAYYGLGITLGDAEVRLDELVSAYSAFARGGLLIEPTILHRKSAPAQSRLVSERTAFWITDILEDDDARSFAFGRGGSLEFPFSVAAKTGTSQAYHDNWVVGYTQRVTVGVWVGNFDRRPLIGSSGISGAGPIFHAIMLAAAALDGALPSPAQLATTAGAAGSRRREICALSGLAASRFCPNRINEWVADDTPSVPCSWHTGAENGGGVSWPVEYVAWAATQTATPVLSLPRSSPSEVRVEPAFRIVSPPDGTVYLLDPTLRREFQSVTLRAAADERGVIEWRIDGARLAATRAPVEWPLEPGRHVITARDVRGRHADATIVVK